MIFHSYVSLPEGIEHEDLDELRSFGDIWRFVPRPKFRGCESSCTLSDKPDGSGDHIFMGWVAQARHDNESIM